MIKNILKTIIILTLIFLLFIIFDPFSSHSSNNYSEINNESTNEYINIETINILKNYYKPQSNSNIKLTNKQYQSLKKSIYNNPYNIEYGDYFDIDTALLLYNHTKINKKTDSHLLNDKGLLDIDKLVKTVIENNHEYMSKGKDAINSFYKELDSSNITKICTIICKVINDHYIDIDINRTANTLMNLKMFERTGSASNAYITNDLTFVFNPTMTSMYSSMQQITNNSKGEEDTFNSVIIHEIMHLLQYSSNDNNKNNGIEAGFSRMYNVPNEKEQISIDSLWYSWLLEASAELNMSEYSNSNPGTYAKKISYVKPFNLSRFNDLNLKNQGLEDMAFYSKLENVFKQLKLNTHKEKKDFLEFMYSIEIIQSDPDDFWKQYSKITKTEPSEEEKLSIRMKIREDAINYLTYYFYLNLADSIYEGKINDLNTIFYLMKTWEIDAYNHLEYTKISSYMYSKEFIEYQNIMQNCIFDIYANSIPNIKDIYKKYTLQYEENKQLFDNCNLDKYSSYQKQYILNLKNNYNTTYYASQHDMYEYFNKNE